MKKTQNDRALGRSQGRSDIQQAKFLMTEAGWLPTYTAKNILRLGRVSDSFRAGYLAALRLELENLQKDPEARYFDIIEWAIIHAIEINHPNNQG
tara:strand:- start:525 stop:809 length:285 start_codon:yes stop_codon:yes gene_type:complete